MMKKLIFVFIILFVFQVNSFGQKNSIQFSPFSVECINFYNNKTRVAIPVCRIFYERKISKYFSSTGGLGYINNSFDRTASSEFTYSGLFLYKQIEGQLGLKASIFKEDRLLKPFFEQDFFYKIGTLDMLNNEKSAYYSTLIVSSVGESLGTRTRVGLDIKLSSRFFVSVNSAVALGFGQNTYHSSVDFIYIDSNYGSNFIITELRVGYRF